MAEAEFGIKFIDCRLCDRCVEKKRNKTYYEQYYEDETCCCDIFRKYSINNDSNKIYIRETLSNGWYITIRGVVISIEHCPFCGGELK